MLVPKKERMSRRKSDPGTLATRGNSDKIATCELPWGGTRMVALGPLDLTQTSGSFVGQSVLLDLFNIFERKLHSVVTDEPLEKLLNKTLQRGGDPYFDNLCQTLYGVSEACLPTVLKILLSWHEKYVENLSAQINTQTSNSESRQKLTKKLLAVNYLFCLVLIEILPQVEFHMAQCDSQIRKILDICFKNVQYRDPTTLAVNNTNHLVVAETYGEVIGVLSMTYFSNIHRIFMTYINELKKETSQVASHQIIALIMAMKFVKIKTNQVHDFEVGVKFLDDLASLMLEAKDKDVKHAIMGLLVEILLPVAAQIKRETNIPALISLVQKLYTTTNDMTSRKQHKLAAFPLQTCLLCVSQKHFFLANWVPFLNVCLSHLKNRDLQVARVALESLYRLLWVYMIRNNCDGNAATRSRLESICGSLFPKGNRYIVPRDAPLNIFVKIIHFISNQKLDFAFKEIIFDLLCVNRSQRSLYAERMNVGIRALMVIADGLQQKDDPPAMPKAMGPSASGTVHKIRKKQYITKPLTLEISRSIGIDQFYPQCRKAFDGILRTLDTQIGKPLMLPTVQNRGKEPDELISGDAKPKLDLFRTCIAAIPRLLPEPMTHIELVDILTRLTVHIDEELRNMSGLTLQTIIGEFPEWREQIFIAQISLIQSQISDFYPQVLDDSLRLLLQLLTTWKIAVITEKRQESQKTDTTSPTTTHGQSTSSPNTISSGSSPHQPSASLCSLPESSSLHSIPMTASVTTTPTHSHGAASMSSSTPGGVQSVLHAIEGLTIVYLCQTRSTPRKIAIQLMREVKILIDILGIENTDTPLITVLDQATPYVVKKYIEHVPLKERMAWSMDFASVCDKISMIETDNNLVNSDRGNEYLQWDPWGCALSGYAEMKHILARCPTAVASAWPTLFSRLNAVSGYVDPNNPQNESRSSLLRGSKSKGSSLICGEQLGHEACLALWQKYLIMCCALAPAPYNLAQRSFSPTNSFDGPTDVLRSVSASLRSSRNPVPNSLSQLIAKTCTILRWENMTDIRDSVVLGVGSINPLVFEMLLEELKNCGILREAMEKKVETNIRRRKRKDLLRLQVIRVLEIAVFRGLLMTVSPSNNDYTLNIHIIDFIDSMRINLESDNDRDVNVVTKLRLHFAKLIHLIIDSTPHVARHSIAFGSYVEQKSVLAMTRVLCCGPIFDASKTIGEDGNLYGWLEKLIVSTNPTMQSEVEEMLAWMLELNESSNLLDWLMTQCYTQSSHVACRCFRALVRVFSRRDIPCEFVSLFVLCQSMLSVTTVTDCALHMIEILRKQFLDGLQFQSTSPAQQHMPTVQMRKDVTTEPYCGGHMLPIEQHDVCHRLANTYPHWTVTIFSEVSYRLEDPKCSNKAHLLSLLQPWIANLELVDQNVVEEAAEGPRGWGSEEATQLVLNNLLYLTATLSSDFEKELSDVWMSLAISFPANLPAILNFFYTTTLLSHEALLPVTKRICVMISQVVGTRISSILLEWLSTSHDTNRISLERCEIPPYYRWRDESIERKDCTNTDNREVNVEREEPSRDGVRLLPMPAYGGHYSPLSNFLPPISQPVQIYSKSEVGLLLICDIIRTKCSVQWAEYAALLFHSSILRLDSLRPALCRHARQTIINVIMRFVDKGYVSLASAILLKNEMIYGTETNEVIGEIAVGVCRGESPSFARATADEYRKMLSAPSLLASMSDLLSAVLFCLSENMDTPLWANEDTAPKNWRVASATQLLYTVQMIVRLMFSRMPMLDVIWTQLAMKMALSSSNRHIAGRCFQIVSALGQPPGPWIPSLMSRLVETADARLSLLVSDQEALSPTSPEGLVRSKSAEQLQSDIEAGEEIIARMQICSIAISIMESSIDNEFLLALQLLNKSLDLPTTKKLQCLAKVDKLVAQLEWKNFNGIIALVTKGAIIPGAYEASIQAMVKLCDVLTEEIVGGTGGIALFVSHTLPYLMLNFDQPNSLCIEVAHAISLFCDEIIKTQQPNAPSDHPFIHLSTVMKQYAVKSFTKDSQQFMKCVLQYICDGCISLNADSILCLLSEMLERGWPSLCGFVLHMIYLLLQHNHHSVSPLLINAQVVRNISRHIQGIHWQETAQIFKVIVEKWRNEVRVRDRLVGILSASGLRIGLPSSTSLVFSKSELGSNASSTERVCASSQEVASTMSLPDPSQSGITGSFPRVFKEFDFLEAEHDSVSETADSCFGWLSTMRPTRDKDDNLEDRNREEEEEEEELEDDDELELNEDRSESDDLSKRLIDEEEIEEDEKTPCPSDDDEEDVDELRTRESGYSRSRGEIGGEDDLRSRISHNVVSTSSQMTENDRLEEENNSVDGSSVCAYSNASMMASDYYPNRPRTLRIQCAHHVDFKVEREFSAIVNELNETTDGSLTAYATLLSTQLYKACCQKVCALLRDASHLVTNRSLSRSFGVAQEGLCNVVDFPFLFVTEQFLRNTSMSSRLKLALNELKEHWETFRERREQCQKAINALRSAYKLSALGGSSSSLSWTNELDLGKLLNKLVFQVMLMSDSLKDMTDSVKNSTGSQTYSLSPAILEHHRELLMCASEDQRASRMDMSCTSDSCDSLVLLLANKRYKQALNSVRALRKTFGEEYGCCETVDIDVLLLLFCRSHSLKAWALVGASSEEITRQSELLREVNSEMATCVRRSQQQQLQAQSSATTSMGSASMTDSFAPISFD
ncbi:unnamed protein product [Caenorhabditis bovis]|uniref:Uncharacterized protein n=1 Tax=Caenorhabditis bovis TaxID=2654633 RepID=A0A8S1EP80_9PELO|nr:unnamed protein product [Caenorhabditis bovis]